MRFVYLADTHLGADPPGYHQQPAYPEKIADILAALDDWINQAEDIDFIIHGGDMLDAVSEEGIQQARALFKLSVPVYLCLGNHDLTTPDSHKQWLKTAPEFFPGGSPEYLIKTSSDAVYVLPNHWSETPYYWGETQTPQFSQHQCTAFNEALNAAPERVRVLVTHSPVFGLPPAQTSLPEPLHEPDAGFANAVRRLIAPHPGIRCVLGAHNHMNMHVEKDHVHYVTVSALMESPFEFKLFDIQPDRLSMTTISLADRLSFTAAYDRTKAFVQGRTVDRAFTSRNP